MYVNQLWYLFKVVTKLPEAMVPDIQQALKTCLRAKETTLISEMQEVLSSSFLLRIIF